MQSEAQQNRLQEIAEILIQGILRLRGRENRENLEPQAEETGHQRHSKACTQHR